MKEGQLKILKSSFGVALSTLLSRFLGLFRVMLEARVLGGDTLASAWSLAFMIPNLFRRLLGEGALGSALVPLLTEIESSEGEKGVRQNLTIVFASLSIILVVIILIVSGLSLLLSYFVSPHLSAEYEHVKLAFKLIPLIMPYALFICLVGISSSILNSKRVFFLPSICALLLNIALISTLAYGAFYMLGEVEKLLDYLCIVVILSGVVQLAFMLLLLWRHRCLPILQLTSFRSSKILKDLWKYTLPGILGGAAIQVGFLLDRGLAAFLGPHAVPALSYTERLVYLPIGVFATALGAVLLTDLSKSATENNKEEFIANITLGLRHTYFVSIPLTAFMIFFREEIITLLFFDGNFTYDDLKATSFAMMFYALGIPVFCAQKIILPAFHSRKQMSTTFKVSLAATGVNMILNLILMWPLQQGGLALGTVLGALFNNLMLLYILRKQGFKLTISPIFWSVIKIITATTVATLVARYLYSEVLSWDLIIWKAQLVPILVCGAIFGVLFMVCAEILHCPEVRENIKLVIRRKK